MTSAPSPQRPARRGIVRRSLAALVAAGCLTTGLPALVAAQELPGFTIFGGPRRENQLSFRLDYGREDMYDRYRLRIPSQNLAINQIVIDYPDYFDGSFNEERITVRYRESREEIPIEKAVWSQENHVIEIFPQEPIPAGNKLEVVLSNVRNPRQGGMYYFNCKILTPGDAPMLRYIGTWILSIS